MLKKHRAHLFRLLGALLGALWAFRDGAPAFQHGIGWLLVLYVGGDLGWEMLKAWARRQG